MAEKAKRARRSNAASNGASARAVPAGEMQPRSAKGVRTRARLLEAAKTTFERDGFLGARIADIADEASMSHGAFYHYFDSKEQVFREVAEQQEVSLLATSAGVDGSHDHIERIRTANRDYLTAYVKSAKIMRVIEEVTRYDDDVRAIRLARDDEFAKRLETSIRRLQSEGVADKRLDAWYAANMLGAMVARFAELYSWHGNYDLDKAVDQLTVLWVNGIGLSAAT